MQSNLVRGQLHLQHNLSESIKKNDTRRTYGSVPFLKLTFD
jgi:hypothetical protein